jgi:hypothetical protein
MQRHRHILTVVGLLKWCNVVSIQALFYWTLGYMKAFSVMANHSKLLVCLIVPWPTIVLWSSNLLFSKYEVNFVLVKCKVVSDQFISCHVDDLCFHNIVGCKPFSVCIVHFLSFCFSYLPPVPIFVLSVDFKMVTVSELFTSIISNFHFYSCSWIEV